MPGSLGRVGVTRAAVSPERLGASAVCATTASTEAAALRLPFGHMDEMARCIDPTTDPVSAACKLGCTPAQVGPCACCQGLTC
jgi:hypothetical protein